MTRWLAETGGGSGPAYDARFAALAAQGVDVHGEAEFVCGLAPPGSAVLDAGCGTGRVAVELARRGYDVVGVDNDASMLAVARRHDLPWVQADLAELDLDRDVDVVVAAGNVLVFLADGTGPTVVGRLAAHLRPGGVLVCGWRTDRLEVGAFDRWALAAGLEPVARYRSWAGEPWVEGADWCVSVDRRPSGDQPGRTGDQPGRTGDQPGRSAGL